MASKEQLVQNALETNNPALGVAVLRALEANDGSDESAALAHRVATHFPEDAAVNHWFGRHLMGRGDLGQAATYLRLGYNQSPDPRNYLWYLGIAPAHLGRYQEIAALGPDINRLAGEDANFPVYNSLALAKLSLAADRPAMVAEQAALEATPHWLDAKHVLQQIADAAAAGRSFAFIRFFDGEARFFSYTDRLTGTIISRREQLSMVNSIWQYAFKNSIETSDPADITQLREQLIDAMDTADVVGVPSAFQLQHDNFHFGYYAALHRLIFRPQLREEKKFADALTHHALHRAMPFLLPLLQNQNFVGYVGCHEGFMSRLAAHMGIRTVKTYLVPGEARQPNMPSLFKPNHFPGRFREVLATLEVPYPGAIFLVGAGLPGRVYCARIKALGGIAIDVGSVVDAWMGFSTRHFGDISQWALPVANGS